LGIAWSTEFQDSQSYIENPYLKKFKKKKKRRRKKMRRRKGVQFRYQVRLKAEDGDEKPVQQRHKDLGLPLPRS